MALKRKDDEALLEVKDDGLGIPPKDLERIVSSANTLNRRGIKVQTAFDGAMALKMLRKIKFDVVLLDIKMPGMDGVEVFRWIQMEQPGLPVILLTGHGSIPQAFETSKEGVYDYLTKPCDMDTLSKVIQEAVAQTG